MAQDRLNLVIKKYGNYLSLWIFTAMHLLVRNNTGLGFGSEFNYGTDPNPNMWMSSDSDPDPQPCSWCDVRAGEHACVLPQGPDTRRDHPGPGGQVFYRSRQSGPRPCHCKYLEFKGRSSGTRDKKSGSKKIQRQNSLKVFVVNSDSTTSRVDLWFSLANA